MVEALRTMLDGFATVEDTRLEFLSIEKLQEFNMGMFPQRLWYEVSFTAKPDDGEVFMYPLPGKIKN